MPTLNLPPACVLSDWSLRGFIPGTGYPQAATAQGAAPRTAPDAAPYTLNSWLPVSVPGDVHTALIAADLLPDPYYDRNEDLAAWVQEREWWYRATLKAPAAPRQNGEQDTLRFLGLDTMAAIYLDGRELARTSNMFREYDTPLPALAPGSVHTLAIRFSPPLAGVNEAELPKWGEKTFPRAAVRKAQFGYGWDWGPVLPTFGIWRPVIARRERGLRLDHPGFATLSLSDARAMTAVRLEGERLGGAPFEVQVSLRDPEGREVAAATRRVAASAAALDETIYLEVLNPQLWWTPELGGQPLYALSVSASDEHGVLDAVERRVGIRTLELDQSPDPLEWGTRFFRFVLNGAPIFARGADWIPADSFVGTLTRERYAPLLEAARDANMNMLRVWGGGIYEHDAFYDLCDELGLLVWQDFMFACAPYPETPELALEVRREAETQVRRLRAHPSLALWCGNNENQWIDDLQHATPTPALGVLYYDQILPQTVAALDGATPYWPGSPYGGNDHNSMDEGDRHNWDVWHGNRPFRRHFGEPMGNDGTPEGVNPRNYTLDMGRFISEFGLHAAPALETLERVIPPGERFFHSASFDHHNKDNPKNKGDNLMTLITGLPGALQEYLDFSQIAQAEGLKIAIEHYRRRKPHCSGALVWQLNDCWPVMSWSVIDYYGFKKAGYYALKRANAPVMASFKETEAGLELWLTNDTLNAVNDTLTLRLGEFDGPVIREETLNVTAPANGSSCVATLGAGEWPGAANRYLSLRGNHAPANRAFFAAIKDLDRQAAQPSMSINQPDPLTLQVTLHAETYAYFTHLLSRDEGARFSDNYLDLQPGESREVTVRLSKPAGPESLTLRAL